jgi:outer membrane protein assembly factor BamB
LLPSIAALLIFLLVAEPILGARVEARPSEKIAPVPYLVKAVLNGARVQFASPAIADLDHDPYQEIVVGTSDGRVIAVKPNSATGTVLWTFDTAAALNAHAHNPSGATIRGAPAIADLDRDGWNEVIVPVGEVPSAGKNGGMVVLSHDGKLRAGWPQMTYEKYGSSFT